MSNILLNKKKTVFNNRAYRKDIIFVFTMLLIPLAHYAIFTLYIDSYSFVLAFQSPTGEWTLGTLKAMFFEVFSAGAVMNVAIRNTLLFFATATTFFTNIVVMLSTRLTCSAVGYHFGSAMAAE